MPADYEADIKARYPAMREAARQAMAADFWEGGEVAMADLPPDAQQERLEEMWAQGGFALQYAFSDLLTDPDANAVAADFVRAKIRQTVRDPEVAEILCAQDHPLGTKRLVVDDGYFETFNRDNVRLVDLRATPIDRVVGDGLITGGVNHPLDTLVFATGFDAFTGAVSKIKIKGAAGQNLNELWAEGPDTYLGLAVAGFPNLFTVTGPGSPSVFTNMMVAIEQHVDWICDCLAHLRSQGLSEISVEPKAQARWGAIVKKIASRTLYGQANSWYVGANIDGKPRNFLPFAGGQGPYKAICDRVAAKGYDGFSLR